MRFTAKDGDIYGNFPKQEWYWRGGTVKGTLHLGGGLDTPFRGPWQARPSPKVYRLIVEEVTQVFPELAERAPVRTWAGPMAFVEGRHGQRMPVIGELGDGAERGVLIAVWCNGYGGTGCH
jgi:glycine/D-amino acid oxidase-like deaminating enzyme